MRYHKLDFFSWLVMSFDVVKSYIIKQLYLMMKTKLYSALLLFLMVSGTFLIVGCSGDDDENPEPPLGDLEAEIDISAISFISDTKSIDGRRIKAGQEVTFADNSSGSPDSREWVFQGGPATSADETASVTWTDQVGQVMVILNVSRSSDGSTDADTLELQVGPVEMLNRVVFGMENQDSEIDPISKWFGWTPNDGTIAIALETSDGANGTSQSLKMTAASDYGEFQLRPHENGPEFLVSLESERAYVFSFYMKGSESLTLSEASFLNVKNDSPVEGWYTPFWSGDAAIADITVSTSWQKYSFEFTTADLTTFNDEGYADGTADNAGPFFKHFASFSGSELSVWVDEVSLKEKETE